MAAQIFLSVESNDDNIIVELFLILFSESTEFHTVVGFTEVLNAIFQQKYRVGQKTAHYTLVHIFAKY